LKKSARPANFSPLIIFGAKSHSLFSPATNTYNPTLLASHPVSTVASAGGGVLDSLSDGSLDLLESEAEQLEGAFPGRIAPSVPREVLEIAEVCLGALGLLHLSDTCRPDAILNGSSHQKQQSMKLGCCFYFFCQKLQRRMRPRKGGKNSKEGGGGKWRETTAPAASPGPPFAEKFLFLFILVLLRLT